MRDPVQITSKRIRVMGPDATSFPDVERAEVLIEHQVSEIDWSVVEDAVSDQLPDGWYCKVED